jgi:hypothetical protein
VPSYTHIGTATITETVPVQCEGNIPVLRGPRGAYDNAATAGVLVSKHEQPVAAERLYVHRLFGYKR